MYSQPYRHACARIGNNRLSPNVLNLPALQRCQFMIRRFVTVLQPEREKTFCAFCIDVHVTFLVSKKSAWRCRFRQASFVVQISITQLEPGDRPCA